MVVALDQLSKWWVVENLPARTIDLFWTLRLRLAYNTGAAFSMGAGNAFSRYIPFLALIVVGVVIWQGRTIGSRLGSLALGLIVGGAVGNLVDRALRTNGGGFFSGAVIDFIDPQWFPIFNIADSCVVVGGFLLVFVSLRLPSDDDAEPTPGDGGDAATDPGPEAASGSTDAERR